MAKKILITGGAGYIGSHTALELLNEGYEVVVYDNLCNSSKESLKRVEELTGKHITFYEGDVMDEAALKEMFEKENVDAVIHCAALKAVGESVQKPLEYYRNNITGTLTLMDVMKQTGVKNIVFSSSATVYGSPEEMPITEECPKGQCTNPYGWTKSMMEQIMTDVQKANPDMNVIILNHVKQQQEALPIDIKVLALDGGYDVGAVHRGLELLGIEGYTAIREYQNNALKKGFTYNQDKDCFVCENQKELNFQRLVFKRSTLNYYRLYSRARKLCKDCPRLSICEIDQGAIRINASGNYPAFHRNKLKYHTPEYVKVMRLRKIWAEGTFSVLKREHNLKRIHKRGIIRAEEECLFSAMALNLKRLVKAM